MFSTSGGSGAQKNTRGRSSVPPASRRQIGQRLRLRRTPELQFSFDETIGHQDRVAQLLKEIAEDQRSTPVEPDPDSPEPDER